MSIQSIAIDALLALSVWATLRSGRLTLAGAGFMASGAFIAALLAPHVSKSFWLCALASASAGFLLGALLDRSVRTLTPISYAIATLAFSFAAPLLTLAPHLTRGPSHPAGNVVSAIACLAAGTAALAWTGERFRFAAGAAAAGLAGALYWSTGGALDPSAFGLDRLGVMVAVALIGGADSPLAPVLSAVLLAGIARLASPLTSQRAIVDGVVLLIALVYLPGGTWAPLANAVRALARSQKKATDGAS